MGPSLHPNSKRCPGSLRSSTSCHGTKPAPPGLGHRVTVTAWGPAPMPSTRPAQVRTAVSIPLGSRRSAAVTPLRSLAKHCPIPAEGLPNISYVVGLDDQCRSLPTELFHSMLFNSTLFYITAILLLPAVGFCEISGVEASPPKRQTIMRWPGLAASTASHFHPQDNRTRGGKTRQQRWALLTWDSSYFS